MHDLLVNLWERSNQGEGYLRHVKSKITTIHTKNWNMNVHINLLNNNAINYVLYNHFTTKSSDEMNKRIKKIRMTNMKQSKMYYIFYYKQHKVTYFVITDDNKYYSTIEMFESEKLGVVEIELKYAKIIDSLAMNFHYTKIDCNIKHNAIAKFDERDIKTYLLMLPELNDTIMSYYHGDKELYYYIESYWSEIDKKNNLIIPKSPCCNYFK